MNTQAVSRIAVLLSLGLALATPALCAWQTFDTSDGLAHNSVLCMSTDRAGNYWFGTARGVSRFDGVTWKTFTTADGLGGNQVNAIQQDHSGALWFGTSGGLTRYDGASWTTYTSADGLGGDRVWAILEDRARTLWIGLDYGRVSRFDGFTWTTYPDLNASNIHAIYEDREGGIWFATHVGGVTHFDGTAWTTYTESDGLAGDIVLGIAQDREGNLWFATRNGASRFDGSSWITFSEGIFRDHYIRAIFVDSAGVLWFGTGEMDIGIAGGVVRYDGERWTSYTRDDGLASNLVTSILEDRAGNLWFGTARGVSRYDQVGWRTYLVDPYIGQNRVRAIVEDRAGRLWFGSGQESAEWDPGGVACYDGSSWTYYGTESGLPSNDVRDVLEDRVGNLWFGTQVGVARFDGTTWTTYSVADGLVSDDVEVILEDSAGNLWFGTVDGLSRFDGNNWMTVGIEGESCNLHITALLEDGAGNLWVGTRYCGLFRFDGAAWTHYSSEAPEQIMAILEDRSGNIWCGTPSGALRFDGTTWRTFDVDDGLPSRTVWGLAQERGGDLWFGTQIGACRYDGVNWRTYTTGDGLADNVVLAVYEDRSGRIWLGTGNGLTAHRPDRVAPLSVFVSRPGSPLASRQINVAFTAAFDEAQVEFSHALDGEVWSPWSPVTAYDRSGFLDGTHTFLLRARDEDYNVERDSATWTFEVDATPPAPVLEAPAFGQVVRGLVSVRGRASDPRFLDYRVDVRSAGGSASDTTQAVMLAHSILPVSSDSLADWDTTTFTDDSYELRLTVRDSLGLSGGAFVEVLVDNDPPWAEVTSPARVGSESGGEVYSSSGDLRVYFPPHAFSRDAVVTISALADSSVPDPLPNGAHRVMAGYDISWGDLPLTAGKTGTLELAYGGIDGPLPAGNLALYRLSTGSPWLRVGGTADGATSRIVSSIATPGRYALYADEGEIMGMAKLGNLSMTPRVFSPQGNFAENRVAISFVLGRPAPVTARIYNRAGRAVRHVLTGQVMNAGVNLVYWDGQDDDGRLVPDGTYLVTVEGVGQTQTKILSVIR